MGLAGGGSGMKVAMNHKLSAQHNSVTFLNAQANFQGVAVGEWW